MVADHIIVKLGNNLDKDDLDNISAAHGYKIRKKMYSPGMYLVETPTASANSVPDAISSLSTDKNVKFTDPDYIIYHFGSPNVFLFHPTLGHE